jgi:hypothetical protein
VKLHRQPRTGDDDRVVTPKGVTADEWSAVPEHLRPYYRPLPDVEDQLRLEVRAGTRKRPLTVQDARDVDARDVGPNSRSVYQRLRDPVAMAKIGGYYDRDDLETLIVEARMTAAADAHREAQVASAGDELTAGFDVCRACGARGETAVVRIAALETRLCDRCAVAAPVVLGELYAADVVDDDGTTRAQRLRDLALAART